MSIIISHLISALPTSLPEQVCHYDVCNTSPITVLYITPFCPICSVYYGGTQYMSMELYIMMPVTFDFLMNMLGHTGDRCPLCWTLSSKIYYWVSTSEFINAIFSLSVIKGRVAVLNRFCSKTSLFRLRSLPMY